MTTVEMIDVLRLGLVPVAQLIGVRSVHDNYHVLDSIEANFVEILHLNIMTYTRSANMYVRIRNLPSSGFVPCNILAATFDTWAPREEGGNPGVGTQPLVPSCGQNRSRQPQEMSGKDRRQF